MKYKKRKKKIDFLQKKNFTFVKLLCHNLECGTYDLYTIL